MNVLLGRFMLGKKTLIFYPHGLGDCVLLTPVLREYFFTTGTKASVATLERFKSAKFFDHNPYVDKIVYTKDAWNDYPNFHFGCQKILEYCVKWCTQNDHVRLASPQHDDWDQSKIMLNFHHCKLKPTSVFTEIFTTDEDKKSAALFIKQKFGNKPFGFVQTKTGREQANLPENYGKLWLKKYCDLDNTIEVGKDYDPLEFSINTQFEIMRQAQAVCLPDSVFFNACGAMGKPVDHLYVAPAWGPRGYARVKPLHLVKQNIVYELDEKIMALL